MSFEEEYEPIDSGHIHSGRYNAMTHTLHLRFQNGFEYAVRGFSPQDHQDFMAAPSQGQHYHSQIKNNFEVTRVK